MGDSEIPTRDVEPTATATAPAPAPEPTAEPTTEGEEVQKSWKENFNVKEMTEIETVDRLRVIAGVNEYKGNFLVFLAKVTDKDFSRQFYSMPAYVWQKALPIIQNYTLSIADVEKKAMADAVLKELQKLKELGIDIGELAKRVQ